jgi:hypothetical protein
MGIELDGRAALADDERSVRIADGTIMKVTGSPAARCHGEPTSRPRMVDELAAVSISGGPGGLFHV